MTQAQAIKLLATFEPDRFIQTELIIGNNDYLAELDPAHFETVMARSTELIRIG